MTEIQALIKNWYLENKRDLPWRRTKNPYYIWLSEVILQQTRVAQGKSYFERFVKKYPKIEGLASASEQEVLSMWQGLGYYSRARNLHTTAKYIFKELNSVFPSKYTEILALKGVGEYTAAAIASFAFDQVYAVLDGNVYRVLSRIFNLAIPIDTSEGKKQFVFLANELLDKTQPALFNQAIMEFGALQCVPGKPNCEICSLNIYCEAFKNNTITLLPAKKGKPKIRNRYFVYFVYLDENRETVRLRKKTENDIWKNMFEFPKIEFESVEQMNEFLSDNKNKIRTISALYKHILSHQHLYAKFIVFSDSLFFHSPDVIEIPVLILNEYPLPRLMERYLEQNRTIFSHQH
ncbi:MAG: A/G-specific adenine glycosylase [Bacteroidota bacterium]